MGRLARGADGLGMIAAVRKGELPGVGGEMPRAWVVGARATATARERTLQHSVAIRSLTVAVRWLAPVARANAYVPAETQR
jgi:hypothetical protein